MMEMEPVPLVKTAPELEGKDRKMSCLGDER